MMKAKLSFHLNNAVIILLVAGILIFLNFVSYKHFKRIDLTKNKTHSLSLQSIKILKNLDKKVKLIGFFAKTDKQAFYDLVGKYTYYTKNIDTEWADPEISIGLAEQYGIRKFDVIVVEGPKKTIKVEELTEESLINAIYKATVSKQKSIYFLTGHKENSISDEESSESYALLKKELEGKGYFVRALNLGEIQAIPEDCEVLVMGGAQLPLLVSEENVLKQYVEKAGKLFLFLYPKGEAPLKALLNEWGVVVHNDLVVDVNSNPFGGASRKFTPLVFDYGTHEITADLNKNNVATIFPLTRSLERKEKMAPGVKFEYLVKSSPNAWGETELNQKQIKFDNGKDVRGPLTLAAVVTKDIKDMGQAQIIIFGSNMIATNNYLLMSGNQDLVLNAFNWFAEEKTLISMSPKKGGVHIMTLTPRQNIIVASFTVIAIPLLVVLFGLVYWMRRRKK